MSGELAQSAGSDASVVDTVRNLIDCHVAATALRLGLPVRRRDRDFEVIARHTRLRVVALP